MKLYQGRFVATGMVALFSLLLMQPARANCLLQPTDSDIQLCLEKALRGADQQLNQQYDELTSVMSDSTRESMRTEQLRWLERRNAICAVDRKLLQKDNWVTLLSGKFAAAECVQQLTVQRSNQLAATLHEERQRTDKSLDDFPLVAETWQERYHGKQDVPVGQFQAYYFNAKQPDKVVASMTVPAVALKYSYADFKGIDSPEFAGYWIGYVDVPAGGPMTVNISLSWSDAKVFLNKRQIYSGGQSQRITLQLEPGRYLMEVQYFNHWHTTEFRASLTPERKLLTPIQLAELLMPMRAEGVGVQFAGVYETGNRDITLPIELKAEQPHVLFLSSYEAVTWRLDAVKSLAQLMAIVLSSYNPGSEIQLPAGVDVPVHYMDKKYGDYNTQPSCSCVAKQWHCEGKSSSQIIKQIGQLTGLPVLGLAGSYSPVQLTVPSVIVDPVAGARFAELDEKLEQKRLRCTAANSLP